MQKNITCPSCGIELNVEVIDPDSIYSCPSCGAEFQVVEEQAVLVASAPEAPAVPKKPSFVLPSPGYTSAPAPVPTPWHPGYPSHKQTVLVTKNNDKAILLLVGSVIILCIVCVTLVVLSKSEPAPTSETATTAKPVKSAYEQRREEVQNKASQFLEDSSESIEQSIAAAKEPEKFLQEKRESEKRILAEMYAERYFDGDEEAGYAMVTEIEKTMEMVPESEAQAKKMLLDSMKKNPVLMPYLAKNGEFPFADKKKDGPMAYLQKYSSFGTGFFISSNGWIVTNRHVVGKAKEVDIRISDGTTHRAKVMKTDEDLDLALVQVETNPPSFLPLSKGDVELSLGRPVFTIGFPNPVLQGIEPKYTDGKISALAGMEDDKNFYQISVPVQPGNSGGALVDTDTGWAVGVITLRLDRTADGRSAQNVSYAIKGSALYRFVENYKKSSDNTITFGTNTKGSTSAYIELAKNSSVQILVPNNKKDETEQTDE